MTYQSVSLNSATSTLQDRISNFTDSANSQINESVSTLPDQFDPGYTADITAITGASGTVSAHSGNTITLSDVSGTWSTGMEIEGELLTTRTIQMQLIHILFLLLHLNQQHLLV